QAACRWIRNEEKSTPGSDSAPTAPLGVAAVGAECLSAERTTQFFSYHGDRLHVSRQANATVQGGLLNGRSSSRFFHCRSAQTGCLGTDCPRPARRFVAPAGTGPAAQLLLAARLPG